MIDGSFNLPAHAAKGEVIEVYAEKVGNGRTKRVYEVGTGSIELTLQK